MVGLSVWRWEKLDDCAWVLNRFMAKLLKETRASPCFFSMSICMVMNIV